MIRAQRRLHARVFQLLSPLLAALFLYALITRQRAADHPGSQPPTQEKTP
jgi:hypothetical protein